MQVQETHSEGLVRRYKVVLPAQDLATKLSSELDALKAKVRINGFRPGKVPTAHLRRVYGRSVMADVLQSTVNEANKKIVDDNAFRLAGEPRIDLPEDKDEVERVMDARGDLEYTVSLELLPKIDVADHSGITLEREVVAIDPLAVDAALERMASANRPFSEKEGSASEGDRVTIDFLGSIDGAPFEGGAGENTPLVIGSNSFIPGFEEQLLGATAGEARTVSVTFPPDYQAANLAGKAAAFAVTVKGVEAPGEVALDDAFAKQFGMDDMGKLREAIEQSMANDFNVVSRRRMKRRLLDALDGLYTFDLPPTLLDQEFANIWGQVAEEMKQTGKSFADEGSTEEESRSEYRKIAERRVRLGLVLAEIGETAKIEVSDDEVSRALVEKARQFPGQEKEVWDFYRKNPQALAEVRAPLFEEKVIDHIIASTSVTEKSVTREELLREDEEDRPGRKQHDDLLALPAETAPVD